MDPVERKQHSKDHKLTAQLVHSAGGVLISPSRLPDFNRAVRALLTIEHLADFVYGDAGFDKVSRIVTATDTLIAATGDEHPLVAPFHSLNEAFVLDHALGNRHLSSSPYLPHAAESNYDSTEDLFEWQVQEVEVGDPDAGWEGTLVYPVRSPYATPASVTNASPLRRPTSADDLKDPSMPDVSPPPSGSGDGVPCYLLCHGFTGDRTQCTIFPRLARALALRGIASLAVGFRFTDPESYVHTTFGTQRDDTLSALDFLLRSGDQYGINSDDIGVLGMSQGGLVASMVAAAGYPRIRRVILWNPVVTPVITYQSFFGGVDNIISAANSGQQLVTADGWHCGPAFVSDLLKASTAAELASFPGNVLVVISTGDKIIPQPHSVGAIARYHVGHTTVVQIPGSDHMLGVFSRDAKSKFEDVDQAIGWTLKWLTRC